MTCWVTKPWITVALNFFCQRLERGRDRVEGSIRNLKHGFMMHSSQGNVLIIAIFITYLVCARYPAKNIIFYMCYYIYNIYLKSHNNLKKP